MITLVVMEAESKINKQYKETLEKLAGHLNVTEEFMLSIRDDNDWLFIIKIHSLIESAITSFMIDLHPEGHLKNALSKLNFGGGNGLLTVANEFKLVADQYMPFIRFLLLLRNKFVHNIKNYNTNLDEYISSNDKLKNQFSVATKKILGEDSIILTQNTKFILHSITNIVIFYSFGYYEALKERKTPSTKL
jgi:hypothetical protein